MTEPQRFQTIVVPMDFSPPAERALALARQLAQAAGPAQLLLVNAYAVPLELEALAAYGSKQVFDELAGETDKQLQALIARLQEADVSAESMGSPGRPDDVIVGLARKRKADLIVMGTHGRTGLPHVLLGSVAERVIRSAPCPVITVK
jgi:nucleotide-binding universal stress UspA family protein